MRSKFLFCASVLMVCVLAACGGSQSTGDTDHDAAKEPATDTQRYTASEARRISSAADAFASAGLLYERAFDDCLGSDPGGCSTREPEARMRRTASNLSDVLGDVEHRMSGGCPVLSGFVRIALDGVATPETADSPSDSLDVQLALIRRSQGMLMSGTKYTAIGMQSLKATCRPGERPLLVVDARREVAHLRRQLAGERRLAETRYERVEKYVRARAKCRRSANGVLGDTPCLSYDTAVDCAGGAEALSDLRQCAAGLRRDLASFKQITGE